VLALRQRMMQAGSEAGLETSTLRSEMEFLRDENKRLSVEARAATAQAEEAREEQRAASEELHEAPPPPLVISGHAASLTPY
jgi:hypothetical protein